MNMQVSDESPFSKSAPRRHCLYHLYPKKLSCWREIVSYLLERIELFNGSKLIGVALDKTTEVTSTVQAEFAGSGCELLFFSNDRRSWESATFWPLMSELNRVVEPDDWIWRGHAKGVTRSTLGCSDETIRRWAEVGHRVCLDDLNSVGASLSQAQICGPFLLDHGNIGTHLPARWHFSGSFYWFRASVFSRDYFKEAADSRYTVEAWPGLVFDRHEADCLYAPQPPYLYSPQSWARLPTPSLSERRPFPKCDVIVTSHNYGHFLGDCLRSVQRQPQSLIGRVLVVDDASTDITRDVAASMGVETLSVTVRDPHRARAAGFAATTSPLVLFLDADNMLQEGYLRSCATQFVRDPQLGIAYMDLQQFGDATSRIRMIRDFDAAAFSRQNFIDTGSVIRREAIQQTDLFCENPSDGLEDWFTFRRLLASGNWRAKWQPVPLLYRRHDSQRLTARQSMPVHRKYFSDACLSLETVTVFTTFSQRLQRLPALWERRLKWLADQSWPKNRLRLTVANTSHQPLPSNHLQLARLEGFAGVSTYDHPVGESGLEDQNRRNNVVESAVQTAVAAIYNRMLREVQTDWCLILEDDVFPDQLDLIERLLMSVDPFTLAVASPYRQRYCAAWSTWDVPHVLHVSQGDGVQEVGGSGFGCLLLRLSQCRNDLFQGNTEISRYFDVDFFVRARQRQLRCKVDWSMSCEHVGQM